MIFLFFEEQVENYKAVCDKEIPKHNPKIIRLFRHTKIENAIKKIKEQEEAKEIQDKVYAQLLADIEANEKVNKLKQQ